MTISHNLKVNAVVLSAETELSSGADCPLGADFAKHLNSSIFIGVETWTKSGY
jgi:hypothetical protein